VGIYGMNFENMPELKNPNGYFIVLGVLFVIVMGMIYYFKRRNWF
jgi:magnesium transporter